MKSQLRKGNELPQQHNTSVLIDKKIEILVSYINMQHSNPTQHLRPQTKTNNNLSTLLHP